MNPAVKLQRGKQYPFLDMADVQPLSRTTNWPKVKVFNGSGARFENKDTLFARITPCLENGKITQALNLRSGGFGSTEFYVLRGKDKVSDNDFVHYLSRTYKIRKLAEGSMIGASGRQRVERAAFENIEVDVPEDINTQKRIASILSAFDDKIELNNKINQTLEQMAKVIFKEWFVKSEKSKVKSDKLETICDIVYGKDLPTKDLKSQGFPVYGGNGIIGYSDKYLYDEPQIIVGCRGAYSGNIFKTEPKSFITHNSLVLKIKKGQNISINYLFYSLQKSNVKSAITGSAQPQITIAELNKVEIPISDKKLMEKFENIVNVVENYKFKIIKENQKLAALRDLLLPKLMGGEIRV
jgi:type I restriction enzyme S subunit